MLVVAEFSHTLAGNVAAAMLGDFGADVIKVETSQGDLIRQAKYPVESDPNSAVFEAECRNKKSFVSDQGAGGLAHDLREIIARSDIFIEDHGPGWLESQGLDPRDLLALSPRLVIVRISPFGQSGPLSQARGDDRTAQAVSGAQFVTGNPDDPPIPIATPLAEYWAGIHAANGALLALEGIDRGNPGQVVDIALYDTILRYQEECVIQYDQLGIIRSRMGNEYAETVPSNHFETSDGKWVAISAADDAPFARICTAVEQPDAATDPRFKTREDRLHHRADVNSLIGEWVARRSVDEVMRAFVDAGAPIASLMSADDILDDPHYAARGAIHVGPSSAGRSVATSAPAPQLSATPGRVVRPAPRLGEHTSEVADWINRTKLRKASVEPGDTGTLRNCLEGLRVLDLGRFIAAPLASTVMADFGADVTKVELPRGDSTRMRPPLTASGKGLSFMITNRNKRSVTLDLHDDEDREAILRLIDDTDVLVENFRPGTLEKFGLSPELLAARNPNLVVVRVSGFGQDGPNRDRSAFDRIGLAFGGMSYVGGREDRAPLRPGILGSDVSAGLFGLFGALVALRARRQIRRGQVVDATLFESIFRMMGDTVALSSLYQFTRTRSNAICPLYPFTTTVHTADSRYVTLSTPRVADVDSLVRNAMVELEFDSADPTAFAASAGRWARAHIADVVVDAVRGTGLFAAVVNSADSLMTEQHFRERGNLISWRDPDFGTVTMQGSVPFLSQSPGAVRFVSPFPGSDNQLVLHTEPNSATAV